MFSFNETTMEPAKPTVCELLAYYKRRQLALNPHGLRLIRPIPKPVFMISNDDVKTSDILGKVNDRVTPCEAESSSHLSRVTSDKWCEENIEAKLWLWKCFILRRPIGQAKTERISSGKLSYSNSTITSTSSSFSALQPFEIRWWSSWNWSNVSRSSIDRPEDRSRLVRSRRKSEWLHPIEWSSRSTVDSNVLRHRQRNGVFGEVQRYSSVGPIEEELHRRFAMVLFVEI